MAGAVASGGLSKFLRTRSIDVQAAALWGVTAGTTAMWVVQPFDWIKKTFFEKSEPQ